MMDSDFFQQPEDKLAARRAYWAAWNRAAEILMGPGHSKGTRPRKRTINKFLAERMRDKRGTMCQRGFRPTPTAYRVPDHIVRMWEGV